MFKKKYLGGLKLLLLPLFIILFATFSTCYALTPISEIDDEFVELIIQKGYESQYYNSSGRSYYQSLLNNIDNFKSSYAQFIRENLNTSITPYVENLAVIYNSYWFYLIPINNTIGDTCPILKVTEGNPQSNVYYDTCYFINDNLQNTNFKYLAFQSSNYNVYQTYNNSFGFSGTTDTRILKDDNNDVYDIKFLYTFNVPGSVYVKLKDISNYNMGLSSSNNVIQYKNTPIEPDEPSGDDGGSGDTPINPSGDDGNGGNIDYTPILGDINNNISNQGTAIINQISGDTTKIVNAIENSNENFWGSSGDLTGEEQEDYISAQINNLVDDISGELSSNSVFQHLDSAENVFLDFFKNKQNEEYYDLIINWDTISPVITMFNGSVTVASGQSIISGDSINISALCRDNPELGKIQQYIRIIFNFGCLIALLWQIYNLVLSTLGIDNPYLYEDAQVTDVVNSDTGEVRSYYRSHKRFYRKR